MTESPRSLYELSLDIFCQYLYNSSQHSNDSVESSKFLHKLNEKNSIQLDSTYLQASILGGRNIIWANQYRQSSSDLLQAQNNLNEKIVSFRKSYHNWMNTIFGKKSECEETVVELSEKSKLYFRVSENICQDIITHLQYYYKINDKTLLSPLFDGDVNIINNLEIEDASRITAEGLKALKKHNLVRLKMSKLSKCTVTELIGSLSPWSIWNLETFSIPGFSMNKCQRICIILSLTRLTNLVHLDVSHTSFNNQCLEIITDHLRGLKSLNLTSTKINTLKPLKQLNKLTHLNLHNVALTCNDEIILSDLTELENLDISDERFVIESERYVVYDHLQEFFEKFCSLKNLTELDLSGRRISNAVVCQFVKYKIEQHKIDPSCKPLRFLGLIYTEFSFTQIFELDYRTRGRIRITGNGKIQHIIQALIRYQDRPTFIQKALILLSWYSFNEIAFEDFSPQIDLNDFICSNDDDSFEDVYCDDNSETMAAESGVQPNEIHPYRSLLVQLIVEIMEKHTLNPILILPATGNLYNLTKNNPYLKPNLLKRVVNACIQAMKYFSNEYRIIKNVLLTLCSDRILLDISFDRFTCIRLVMDTLLQFTDIAINRLALGISAILAGKIPTVETALMGSQSNYLKRLLDLVHESYRVNSQNSEIILKLSLSALWNFTDEAPKTCETFIEHNGIELYYDTLLLFEGKSNIETKILGLLNNIAEVPNLRKHLVELKVLQQIRKLIESDDIDVSYFAIGILVQLASDSDLTWTHVEDFNLDTVLEQMSLQIQSWPNPLSEMVAYRSFEPFLPLLRNARHPSISLWALWAIHHVCTKNPKKYCRMLFKEKCIDRIALIILNHLKNEYSIECSQTRIDIVLRLINFVTVPDDNFQMLSKVKTNWNCYLLHKWNIFQNKICDSTKLEQCQFQTECLDSFKPEKNEFNFINKCDCLIKIFLDNDPFLRLPSIILKSFRCFSPIPLKLDLLEF